MTQTPDSHQTEDTQSRPPVAGVLLAGGLSRRMGGTDKALLELSGRPMLAHVRDRLVSQVDALALNANGDPERFAEFGLPVIADPIEGFIGPLAGILAGMRWAKEALSGARWVVSAACDTPFFPTDLVDRFVDAVDGNEGIIALGKSGEQVQPVFGLWPVALADDLETWLRSGKTNKVLAWVDQHRRVDVSFDSPVVGGVVRDPFFNANTPQDMETAAAVLAELAS